LSNIILPLQVFGPGYDITEVTAAIRREEKRREEKRRKNKILEKPVYACSSIRIKANYI
jgi:hypothetical protein